jgi:uncharacterized Zn-binding protein involved in type VI secretion
MPILTNGTKATLAGKTAKGLVKYPAARRATIKATRPSAKLAFKVGKPVVKRRAKQQLERIGEAAERFGEVVTAVGSVVATYGPDAARQLGLLEPPPKPKRTAPRVAVGVVIGGVAVYFLDPDLGPERRKRVAGLVS